MSLHSEASFFEDLEPRKPPPIPNYPLPFGLIDKPGPLVPDVSLIFDGSGAVVPASASAVSNSVSASAPQTQSSIASTPQQQQTNNKKGSPVQDQHVQQVVEKQNGRLLEPEFLVQEVTSLSKKFDEQEEVISRIELKLDKILAFQEKLVAQFFQKDETSHPRGKTSLSRAQEIPNSSANKPVISPNGTARPKSQSPSDGRSSVNSSTPMSSRRVNQEDTNMLRRVHQRTNNNDIRGSGVPKNFSKSQTQSKADEDLSAILKDIQLPNMNEPSHIFSDVSGIKSLELMEYNDDSFRSESGVESPVLGASASGFASSSLSSEEDEGNGGALAVKPSATFYNNVLGNVNRLLKNTSSDSNEMRRPRGNLSSDTNRNFGAGAINREQERRSSGQQVVAFNGPRSNSSSSSSSSGDSKLGRQMQVRNQQNEGVTVVEATKRYLEKMGVQFESPTPAEKQLNLAANSNNYMIQQNVYNSIYIPTVNCVPPISETVDSNATSGNFTNLARKYVPQEELQHYETAVAGAKGNGPGGLTDTTFYGMSSNNLSFATKQYLQRYGLVNEESNAKHFEPENIPPKQIPPAKKTSYRNNDKILDITAIQQQPKLL